MLSLLFVSPSLNSQENILSGPLYGKNYYLPHLPVYSFPGFSPRPGHKGDIHTAFSYTGYNEFTATDTDHRVLDYEGSALDFSVSCRPQAALQLGMEGRIISYYGGFFDPAIELWHGIFGFPNGGREHFNRNEVFVQIENGSGRDIHLNKPLVDSGDVDLFGIWTFYSDYSLNLAVAGALKLPFGSLGSGTGSGYLDGACQFLGAWLFHSQWELHFQQGVVIPGDLWAAGEDNYASQISLQTFLTIQYMPRTDWAFLLQTRINTSPLFSEQIRYTALWGASPLFTMPQTSVQVGFKKAWEPWSLQVYFEEDPLTYEGLDILFSVRISHFFKK